MFGALRVNPIALRTAKILQSFGCSVCSRVKVSIFCYVLFYFLSQIYDIATGKRLLRLYDSEQANNYKANRAVFNPTDEMVLNDGVLWDLRSGRSIHKFDKFNQYVSGVFHPVGLEIIINSEVVSFRCL